MATEIIQTEQGTLIVKDGIAYRLITNNTSDPTQPVKVEIIGSSVTLEVHLDPENDGVEISGSDDGGTTQRIIKTLADGTLAADPAIASQTTLALVAARLLNGTDSAAKLLADVLAKMISAPATEAKQDSIIALLTPTYHAPVGNSYEITESQTLAEITSAAIPAWVREVTLIPRSTGVYWSTSGDASDTTMALPLGGISIAGNKASLATIELYADSSTVVDIIFTGVSA